MKESRRTIFFIICLAIGSMGLIAEEEIAYPLTTFKNFRQNVPLPEPGDSDISMDLRLLRFSAVVEYQGEHRPLTDSKKETMKLLENVNTLKGQTGAFDHEVLIKDELRRELWIPANKALVQRIDAILNSGEKFTAMFTYLGCCYDRKNRILFMNRIDFQVNQLPRYSCFTEELLGFTIKSDFAEALSLAEERYGPPVKTLENERKQRVYIYLIEEEADTVVYLRDGGPEFADILSSIQVSSYAGSTMTLMPGLSLGDEEKDIEDAIGRDLRVQKGEHADLLYYQSSACTFEMRNGQLFSIFVAEDPYY
ncbi:MAG: hypothetical protein CMF59_15035 [Leptospiraceae bacterium]|nr:hypothetical protein [Leptospiraceae bacterium]